MPPNRVFFPQQALNEWLDEGRITLQGSELGIGGTDRRFRLLGAVHFMSDVSDTGDPHGLIGKVKTIDEVHALSGEYCADSVVLGECAYQVADGFVGEPLPSREAAAPGNAPKLEPSHPLAKLLAVLSAG